MLTYVIVLVSVCILLYYTTNKFYYYIKPKLLYIQLHQAILASNVTTHNNHIIVASSKTLITNTKLQWIANTLIHCAYVIDWEDLDQIKHINNIKLYITTIDNVKTWQKIATDGIQNNLSLLTIIMQMQKINLGFFDDTSYNQLKAMYKVQKLD